MRQFENPVQKEYYDQLNKIWAGGIDDWFDMNNFMFALLAFVKDKFHDFSFFTESCLSDNDSFDGGK